MGGRVTWVLEVAGVEGENVSTYLGLEFSDVVDVVMMCCTLLGYVRPVESWR